MSDETQQTPVVLTEQQKAELAEFVAGQMFANLKFNQVLLTIENQCRAQAQTTVNEADAETLAKIQEDFIRLRAENEMLGGQVIQEGAPKVPDFDKVPTP